jgi:hypothetical protein
MDGLESLLKHGFKTCFILRGLPGRGKTTFAYKLKEYLESLHYSTEISAADDFLVNEVTGVYEYNVEKVGYAHIRCTKKLVDAMGRGVDAVIQHNTNVKDWESASLRSNVFYVIEVLYFRHTLWDIWCILWSQSMHGLRNETFQIITIIYTALPESKLKT